MDLNGSEACHMMLRAHLLHPQTIAFSAVAAGRKTIYFDLLFGARPSNTTGSNVMTDAPHIA